MQQTWAIMMTVREPSQLVLTNVAWHLSTGAQEVHVYLDDPRDPIFRLLSDLPGTIVTRCDAAYWAETAPRRKRPDSLTRLQALNANHALARCEADWMFHIDADEFLMQTRPLAEELAVVSELGCELHLPVAERLYPAGAPRETIFDGVFRTSTKALNRRGDGRTNDPIIFGDHLPVLLHGVLGHSAGKCGVRVGTGLRLGVHWAYKGDTRHRAERYKSTSTRLLHFDGLTPLHWMSKLLRYRAYDPAVMNVADHRRAQIELFQDMGGTLEAGAELHAELREFDEARLARLRAFGLLCEENFDPRPVIAPCLPTPPDLTVEGFDAALLRQSPDLKKMLDS